MSALGNMFAKVRQMWSNNSTAKPDSSASASTTKTSGAGPALAAHSKDAKSKGSSGQSKAAASNKK